MSSLVPESSASLGKYRLLLELGAGGMARAYVAFSSGLAGFHKLVVLKVMREEVNDHQDTLAMFLDEAKLAARMNHPNIVQTLEVGEDRGKYFICMEFLEGLTLGRLLKRTFAEPLPLGARLELMSQVLDALIYMHEFRDLDGTPLHLVHRDLSPNNVFVTFDGTAKVLDFGVAKAAGVSRATEAGTFKGKFGYAAPEQMIGHADQRADLFAMGVMLWETTTGERLHHGRTQQEIVQGRLAGVDAQLMRRASSIPEPLLEICLRAAAREPDARFSSASEMRDALRACIKREKLEFSSEELRTVLSRLFASERAEIRRTIDVRMKQAQSDGGEPGTFTHSSAIPKAPAVFGPSGTMTGLLSTGGGWQTRPPAPSNAKWIALGIAAAALAAVAGALLTRTSPPLQAHVVNAAPISKAPPSPEGPAVKKAELVSLKVNATPLDAQIYLDGARLEGNPFNGLLPKDPGLHRLEVRHESGRSEARMIALTRDQELTVDLRVRSIAAHVAPAAHRSGPSPKSADLAVAVSPAPNPTPALAPGDGLTRRKPSENARPIDDSDPYTH
ncbi:MAG TPA: serine/threonine-protein kinase [Polyangiaceae bacterium]|nr:serine/threonine-protein kinase [Polyangiaceae bacterium]